MMLGEHDLIDKRWMLDESMRMPFMLDTPEYMHGKSFANVLDNQPLENWRTATYYRYWMHRAHHDVPAHFGVRSKEHKLIFYYAMHYDMTPKLSDVVYEGHDWSRKDGVIPSYTPTPVSWELYDLTNDPEELHNKYNDPAYKDVIAKLKAELKKQRKLYNETDVNFPHLQAVIDKHWNN